MPGLSDIASGLTKIQQSAFVGGHTKKSYEDANPAEAGRVFAYLSGGNPPNPWPTTLMGQGLSEVERGRRTLASQPPVPGPGEAYSDPTAVVMA